MQDGYQVRFENYHIGDSVFRIRSLLDRQQYSDPSGEAAQAGISSANWPLFGSIWPSGQVLARLMNSHPVGNRRILEAGCGLALASIVLQRRGADITASDYHPMVPVFLARNMTLNNLADIDTITGDWAVEEPDPELFDLIIGADLLYERGHFDTLSAFINRHARPTAEVIIVDPNRGHVGKFNRKMLALGYDCSEERADTNLAGNEAYTGRILTYRRSADQESRLRKSS